MPPRLTLSLAATAALALAGCGETKEPDERIVGPAEADPDAVDVQLPEIPVETPTVSTTGPDDGAQEAPEE
jgi:hypothetical protein